MAEITESKTIEEVFQELDTLAAKLEDSETSLEDSFRFYKEGMELLKYCKRQAGHSREEDAPDGRGWNITRILKKNCR